MTTSAPKSAQRAAPPAGCAAGTAAHSPHIATRTEDADPILSHVEPEPVPGVPDPRHLGTEPPAEPSTGPAGAWQDPEAFFLAAYAILGSSGQSAVTVAALCERVGVTKGSFYHHFGDMPRFVEAFAGRWQGWVLDLLRAYRTEQDLRRRLELMCNSHIVAVNGSEPAVRSWARSQPALAAAVRKVDGYGQEVCSATFEQILGDEKLGDAAAALAVTVMIGLQQRIGPVDNGRFVRMEVELLHRLCGVRTYVEWADFGLALRVSPWSTRALRERGADISAVVYPLWSDEADKRPSPKAGRPRRQRPLRTQDFFTAARRLLADHGCDAITVVRLCNALAVTKGSFSHHFAGMDDFVTRMAAAWSEQRQQWLDQCAGTPEPHRRLAALYLPLLERPEAADSAWHAWGWTNPTVGRALAQVEARWQELLTTTLTELEHDPAAASLLAEMTVALAVGLGQRQQPLEASDTAIVVLLWLTTALGVDAQLVDEQIRLVVHLPPADSAEASSRRAPSGRNRI